MSLSAIGQRLEDIDYSPNKPSTYLVFVPVLSLLIQKIQLDRIQAFPHVVSITQQNVHNANANTKHYTNICKWHLTGSTTQMLALALAVSLFANSWFPWRMLPFFLASSHELMFSLLLSMDRVPFYEFPQNGNRGKKIIASACTII